MKNNNKLIEKIKEWLEYDSSGVVVDRITEGRKECADCLLEQIHKWESKLSKLKDI